MGAVSMLFKDIKSYFMMKVPLSDQEKEIERMEVEKELKLLTDNMTSRYCPINRNNCMTDCIHFSKGFITEYDNSLRAIRPWCNLWD